MSNLKSRGREYRMGERGCQGEGHNMGSASWITLLHAGDQWHQRVIGAGRPARGDAPTTHKVALRARRGDRRAATEYRASPRWAAPRRAGDHPAGGWDCSGVAGWPAWRL